MPYVITTKRPDALDAAHRRLDVATEDSLRTISRRAVATLEERMVFDAREWNHRDVGDNSQFFHNALILDRSTTERREEIATVLFLHDGRVSRGHFTDVMRPPPERLMPESGGTVGPPPDGTTIQVESVSLGDLAKRAGVWDDFLSGATEAEIIDAFAAMEMS